MAKKSDPSGTNGHIKFWASLIKELGIPSFLVLFFVLVFLWFGTSAQKEEFVDKFFLFKGVDNNPFPFSIVVVALIIIIIMQWIYYNKIIKLHMQEISKIGEEKSELEHKLLNKKLHSSS